MSTLTIHTTRSYILTIDDEEGERTFELSQSPDEFAKDKIIVQPTPDGGTIIGYLVRDDDCQNPLEDCDGMGKIYDRRHRYSDRETRRKFCEALRMEMDSDGDPVAFPPKGKENPYAVMLDVYEHSGSHWSLMGHGMQCQWDTSQCAGVWDADESCREHIDYEAHKPDGVTVSYATHKGKINTITMTMPDGTKHYGYKTFATAAKAAARRLGIKWDKSVLQARIRDEAHKCAQQAVDEYNKWLIGDCWGIVIDTFGPDGKKIDDESDDCWGFIGDDHAIAELQDDIKGRIAA